MRKLPLLLLVGLFSTTPTLGQTDVGEVFGGYSLERIAPGCGSNYRCGSSTAGPTTNLNGWIAALTVASYKGLGVTAQFAGNYNGIAELTNATVNRYTYQFGPEYAFHLRNARIFAHALFGGITQQSSFDQTLRYNRFLWSVGGGLDFKASTRFSIRPVQLDYERQSVQVEANGPPPFPTTGVNGLRYSAGIVLNLKSDRSH